MFCQTAKKSNGQAQDDNGQAGRATTYHIDTYALETPRFPGLPSFIRPLCFDILSRVLLIGVYRITSIHNKLHFVSQNSDDDNDDGSDDNRFAPKTSR